MSERAEPALPAGFQIIPDFLNEREADALLPRLREELPWQRPQVAMFGRRSPVPRLVTWQADPGLTYRYAGLEHRAAGWHPVLAQLRQRLADEQGLTFNSVLANWYRNGQDSMGWHRDNEPEINPAVIASVSFGAARDFKVRHRTTKEGWTVSLGHGDLLAMEHLQADYDHALPRRARVHAPRLNLTFRHFR